MITRNDHIKSYYHHNDHGESESLQDDSEAQTSNEKLPSLIFTQIYSKNKHHILFEKSDDCKRKYRHKRELRHIQENMFTYKQMERKFVNLKERQKQE